MDNWKWTVTEDIIEDKRELENVMIDEGAIMYRNSYTDEYTEEYEFLMVKKEFNADGYAELYAFSGKIEPKANENDWEKIEELSPAKQIE